MILNHSLVLLFACFLSEAIVHLSRMEQPPASNVNVPTELVQRLLTALQTLTEVVRSIAQSPLVDHEIPKENRETASPIPLVYTRDHRTTFLVNIEEVPRVEKELPPPPPHEPFDPPIAPYYGAPAPVHVQRRKHRVEKGCILPLQGKGQISQPKKRKRPRFDGVTAVSSVPRWRSATPGFYPLRHSSVRPSLPTTVAPIESQFSIPLVGNERGPRTSGKVFKRACYSCGQVGHRVRECPEGRPGASRTLSHNSANVRASSD